MTKVYDPASITMSFAGINIQGLADGEFVSLEQNEDAFTVQIGSDGDGTRSKSNNRSGRVTFTLMMSSSTNDLLSALHTLDLESPSGAGIGPLMIKDLNGTTLITAERAWITRFPTAAYDREATSREWIIETDKLIQLQGGNN
jgi:hypothetical protein